MITMQKLTSNFQNVPNQSGARGSAVVEALRYKLEGRGFDFRWSHWIFFIDTILPAALWPYGAYTPCKTFPHQSVTGRAQM
jgi:hypothetical protein